MGLGAVLVFMPGLMEITKMHEACLAHPQVWIYKRPQWLCGRRGCYGGGFTHLSVDQDLIRNCKGCSDMFLLLTCSYF